MCGVEWVAIDTEFISERYYQPLLCLIQIATPTGFYLIDPLANIDTKPFWDFLVEGDHETIVHAGRFEMDFCYRYTQRFPKQIFDTQVATGLVSLEYPIGYSNMVQRFLGISPPRTESRTNWKRRPLTSWQVEYAVDDVVYLNDLRKVLLEKLQEFGRLSWFRDEMRHWLSCVEQHLSPERWRRILGAARWSARELAIVKSLWEWREAVAMKRNCSPKHVLRDDLILEIAKRKVHEIQLIRNIRGLERDDMRMVLEEISRRVREALNQNEDLCPAFEPAAHNTKTTVLGTFLSSVLSTICMEKSLSASLVGTTSDVRDWIAWKLHSKNSDVVPILAQGWRAEVVGASFDELLSGKKLIRINDPRKSSPIEFVSRDDWETHDADR